MHSFTAVYAKYKTFANNIFAFECLRTKLLFIYGNISVEQINRWGCGCDIITVIW